MKTKSGIKKPPTPSKPLKDNNTTMNNNNSNNNSYKQSNTLRHSKSGTKFLTSVRSTVTRLIKL